MPETQYPGATWQDRTKFAGITMTRLEKVLWHTTESAGWPGYPTFAPQLTVDPRRRQVRQHMPLNRSASTLADPSSTAVRENRDNVVQIEVVAYCDPQQVKSVYHISKWGDEEYRFLAQVAAWFAAEWDVPLTSTVRWVSYPASYGLRASQRLTSAAYDAYRGHLGHQHAPGNSHGDPGDIDIARLLRFAREIVGAAQNPTTTTYTVKPGDNLTRIAAAIGTTVPAIVALNPALDPNHIQVGQVLTVPATDSKPEPAPPTPEPEPEPEPEPPKPLPTYAIKAGDTLTRIAARYDLTWQQLAALTPGIDPNRLRVGQVINVPAAKPKPDPPEKPKSEPKPEEPKMTNVRIGVLNVGDNNDEAGRRAALVDTLAELDASIYLLQECSLAEYPALFQALGKRLGVEAWTKIVKSTKNDGKLGLFKAGNRVVLFDPSKWDLRDRDSVTLTPDARQVPAVRLRSRATRAELAVGSVHLSYTAAKAAARDGQARQLLAWLDKLGWAVPWVIGGDLNDDGTVAKPGSVRDIMRAGGFTSGMVAAKDATPTHRAGRIDDGLFSADVVVRGITVGGKSSGTDHRSLLLRVGIPG